MKNLSFENRVLLTRKRENLTKAVEELSSSYAKREEFASENSHVFTTYTSEICSPLGFICIAAAIVYALGAVVAAVGVAIAAVAAVGVWVVPDDRDSDSIAMIDSTIYKNIV